MGSAYRGAGTWLRFHLDTSPPSPHQRFVRGLYEPEDSCTVSLRRQRNAYGLERRFPMPKSPVFGAVWGEFHPCWDVPGGLWQTRYTLWWQTFNPR